MLGTPAGSTADLCNVIKLRIPQKRGPTFFEKNEFFSKKGLTNEPKCAVALAANIGILDAANATFVIRRYSDSNYKERLNDENECKIDLKSF